MIPPTPSPTRWSACLLALLLFTAPALRAADRIPIEGSMIDIGGDKFIPVSISGFTGETASALKFDLEIAGFEVVPEKEAAIVVSGKNTSGRLEARALHKAAQSYLVSKAYTGDNARSLAHALADDIVLAVTKQKGIAQTRVAFKVDTGAKSEIYLADYDGYNAVKVTADSSIVAAPCWSPANKKLLYTTYKYTIPCIVWHDLASGERDFVARYGGLNTSPNVSPNGRRAVMILSKDGSPDVYASDLNGDNLVRLTRTRADESSPCWSPDGATVCFASRESGRAQLYTVPASGGTMRRLSTAGVSNATEPDWSPDGKTIIFTTLRGDFELCTIPSGGGNAESAARLGGEDPSWAPNSRHVLFTRRVGGRRVLSLLDVETKRVKDIKQVSGSCSQPAWSR